MKEEIKIPVGVSNRHVHLTKQNIEKLFGEGYELHKKSDLTQPGQFASVETVTIKTEKSEIQNVRVLGPARNYNQVEISQTDAYKLGLNPPVRKSGNIKGSSPITIIGPNGEIFLEEGCILANRHIHISKEDSIRYNLPEDTEMMIKIDTEKGGILTNVYSKVTDEAYLELHLDTDDANSHLLKQGDIVTILRKEKEIEYR